MTSFLYTIGRLLQIAGMGSLILGSAGNMADKITTSAMYQFLLAGIGLFVAGYMLQQAVKK